MHWETPTARLLPRLLAGRTAGPVFLADRRAEYLFKQVSNHSAGYTLHQLRHSGLTHLATLGIYVRLGEETSARITAENDEHHRRHRR